MTQDTVTLGANKYAVRVLPFKVLKKVSPLVPLVGAALARGLLTEDIVDDMGAVVAAGIDMDPVELAELSFGLDELSDAFRTCVIVAGMVKREQLENAEREQRAGETAGVGTGTISTPGSSSTPDGPGSTSTTT